MSVEIICIEGKIIKRIPQDPSDERHTKVVSPTPLRSKQILPNPDFERDSMFVPVPGKIISIRHRRV